MTSLTPARCRSILALVLALGFAARFLYLMDSPINLVGDEAHYWDWSRQLDLSYYSKGPAVAYIMRFGTTLFGNTELGVRFPSLLFAIGTSLCTYWLTLRILRSDKLALGAVLLCHLVPMFVLGSMLMTIDPPYYFGWALATCLAHVAIVDGRRWAWIGAGVMIGLAFLAKYAALLWLLFLLLFLLLRARRWLRTPWPWLTIVVALAFTTPVIVWNAQHDWVTFGHVSRSTTENQAHFNPLEITRNLGVLLGSQFGILNPIVFAFMVASVISAIRFARNEPSPGTPGEGRVRAGASDGSVEPTDALPSPQPSPGVPGEGVKASDLVFLLCFSLPFFAICVGISFLKEIEPNWPAPTYFALVPLATWWIAKNYPKTKGWLIGAIVIGLAVMPVAHFSTLLYPIMPVEPRRWDPSATRMHGGADVGHEVSVLLHRGDLRNPFIVSDKYYTAGLLAFYVEGNPKTYTMGSYFADPRRRDRLSQYDMWPDRSLEQSSMVGRDAIYVGKPVDKDKPLYGFGDIFERVEGPIEVPIIRNGVKIRNETIYIGHNFKGMKRPNDGMTRR